jgi:hypothetical protein
MEECRIYLSPRDESIFCLVSPEDYLWALQWKWQFTLDRHKVKMYATRSTWEFGRRKKIYMHKAILSERMESQHPSPAHHIGDHGDSDSLNNKRGNLEWVTAIENASRKRSIRWRHLPANDNTEHSKAA